MKLLRHLSLLLFHIQVFMLYCSMNKVVALDAGTDREALFQFKSMVSDPQGALSSWNFSSSHCTWFGVSCTANNGNRVRSLRLAGLGLSGIISPQLSNLTSLLVLNLFNNSFYGQIPEEFSRLTLLQRIVLATNSINGTVPAGLSECHNLKEIRLEVNQLTGNLPSELGHLRGLEHLDVSVNNLTGEIPPAFGNLTQLTFLGLARNQLFGSIPNKIGHLRKLLTLQLSENHLTGNMPSSISNMSSLVYLSLAYNDLSGELPTNMGTKLKELYLAHNKLGGLIPASLSNASQIQKLDLSSNNLQGKVPLLGTMKNLVILHLGINNLSSTTELNFQILSSLANCTQLQLLMLNSNQLSGELPSSVANLSAHLIEFCVDDNFLTGGFPQGFEKFQNLTAMALHQNSFTGEIPSSILKLQKLRKFSVQQNMFSGQIPDVFGNITNLHILTMGYNQFSGRIPASIGKCLQLFTLGLRWNRLNGSIPKEIFGISSLSNLNLEWNSLSGSLPLEVGGLTQLEFMNVSNNVLSGNIPTEIGACLSLRNLSLARNQLVGSITESMGKLAALESLDLSSNSLSGPIPTDLENLRTLQDLNLSFNGLEGQVPTQGVFMKLSRKSLQGNIELCGSNQEVAERLGIPTCFTKKKSSKHLLLKIMIPVAGSTVVVCSIACFIWALISYKKNKRSKGTFSSPPFKGLPQLISYSEIWRATNGFAEGNLIGKGGFGSVYKGSISAGENGVHTTFAIKVLDLQLSKACKSFNAECEALRSARHRNLVKVFTSCSSIDHGGAEFKALIMEFMINGNLDQWLYPEDTELGSALSLTQRLNIAIDVASAMDYLHHDCDPPIVHCDLKPGNVLLDDDMGAHVGDFGLSRFLSPHPSQSESSTIGLTGTIGYIAPEYGLGSKASTNGDVYSFGVLVLEMFTAKKPTDEMFQEGFNLTNENHVLGVVDSRLLNENGFSQHSPRTSSSGGTSDRSSSIAISRWHTRSEECLAAVVKVGSACAAFMPKERLTMRETLTKLQDIKAFLLD